MLPLLLDEKGKGQSVTIVVGSDGKAKQQPGSEERTGLMNAAASDLINGVKDGDVEKVRNAMMAFGYLLGDD